MRVCWKVYQREFEIIQNIESCPSLTKQTSMAGFFSKKQYAAKRREVFPEMSRRFQENISAFSLKCREVFRQCFLFLTPLRSASGGGVVLVSLRNQFQMEKNSRGFGKHKWAFCAILIYF